MLNQIFTYSDQKHLRGWDWPKRALKAQMTSLSALAISFIAALARSERRANAVNSVLVMCLSFVGGSFFPARQLPPLFRDHLSPLMPNYWFIESLRALQSGGAGMPWGWAALKLCVFGLVLVLAASWVFQRALAKGSRA